jgi:TetR/AcrR family transcriptional repressor of nem operon
MWPNYSHRHGGITVSAMPISQSRLGVTKASLHYHFPSKAELGRALIERYRTLFGAALEAIDEQAKKSREKLQQYVGLYVPS